MNIITNLYLVGTVRVKFLIKSSPDYLFIICFNIALTYGSISHLYGLLLSRWAKPFGHLKKLWFRFSPLCHDKKRIVKYNILKLFCGGRGPCPWKREKIKQKLEKSCSRPFFLSDCAILGIKQRIIAMFLECGPNLK